MFQFKYSLLLILVLTFSLYAQEEPLAGPTAEEEKESDSIISKALSKVVVSAGYGRRKTSWKFTEKADNTNTSYDIKDANYDMVEGDFAIPSVAAKLGFNIQQESTASAFSKVSSFAGYVGLSGMVLRSERGKFAGSAYFSGNITPDQTRYNTFENVYTFTELDYEFNLQLLPVYVGLRYTKWKLPTEIALLGPNQTSGPSTFDTEFESEFYSFIMGMDFFYKDLMPDSKDQGGWGAMFSFLGGFGFGSSKFGPEVADRVQTIYGKTLTETNPSVFVVHTSGQLGIKYKYVHKRFKLVIGAGYDWNILMLINNSRQAESNSEVQPVAYPNFIYHGPIFRIHGTF